MERLKLVNLVAFAKLLSSDQQLYRPGMEIVYRLDSHDHELLQMDLFLHANKTTTGFIPTKTFEFDIMDVKFVFKES